MLIFMLYSFLLYVDNISKSRTKSFNILNKEGFCYAEDKIKCNKYMDKQESDSS